MAAYYADDVEPPKPPGDLAIQTWADSESALKMDVDAANRREDIGRVRVWSTPQ